MSRIANAVTMAMFCGLLVLPSFAFAKEAKPAFDVRIIQGGKTLAAQDGVINVSRQTPFELRTQAPARTAIFINVTGTNAKIPILKGTNIHSNNEMQGYALLSDGLEYLWYRLQEKGTNPRLMLRKRWASQTIEGFNTLSGSHWKLGTYILDEHLTFTVAAVPVDARGNLRLSGKTTFSAVRIQLGTPSQEDDCQLMQNMMRNFGSQDIPSCEELLPQ